MSGHVCTLCGQMHPRYMCPKSELGLDNARRILFAGQYQPMSPSDLNPGELGPLVHASEMFKWLDLDPAHMQAAMTIWTVCREGGDAITWLAATEKAKEALEEDEDDPDAS